MLGHVTFGEDDFARGAARGPAGRRVLKFHLTIVVDDIERFSVDPRAQRGAFGWLVCDALGGRLPVERGVFNLFVDTEPGVKHMLYRLFFRDGAGHPLTLTRLQAGRDDAGFDVWSDTTTLFTRVLRGHVDDAGEDGRGARRLRRAAHPRARLRAPAHDVPRRARSASSSARSRSA